MILVIRQALLSVSSFQSIFTASLTVGIEA